MKAFLMYRDKDFDMKQELPVNESILTQDLELDILLDAMAQGDEFLSAVARVAVLSSSNEIDVISYRQNILKDCLKNISIVRDMYDIVAEPIKGKKNYHWSFYSKYPSSILYGSVELMQMFMDILKRLKNIADEHADKFESEGFTVLFNMLKKEFDDEYFACVQNHLRELKFRDGVLISAELGKGNKGINYTLCKSMDRKDSWMKQLLSKKSPVYTFSVGERDWSGARAISELKDRGLNLVANVLAQSVDHILGFFNMLQTELAFYIGCLNLYEQLVQNEEPTCFPVPLPSYERKSSFNELYDVCLALTLKQKIVGNDLNADNKDLVIITGANQGGKSTFLRSVGLAQLMMQCGMFVSARYFSANMCEGLFTHYRREEDASMNSGKLDEELSRMSDIADSIKPDSLLLFNESFAATNEREGSEIGRQITCALLERRIKIFSVTHMYEFAHGFYEKNMDDVMFLRAERQAEGVRTFKIIEGEPLRTSFGIDLYNKIFGNYI